MNALILTFAVAFGLSLGLTCTVRWWAWKAGLVDVPDGERHAHERTVPRVGGIAVVASVVAVAGALFAAELLDPETFALRAVPLAALLGGGGAIFGIGLWDDIRGLPARTKFLLEIVVAAAAFAGGLAIREIGLPGVGLVGLPIGWSCLITVVWMVGITNAFNLIDGSDGIAAGAALFASAAIAVVSLSGGNELGAFLGLALAGATLGFLFFNFPPASIFLGDSGSLFLGFTLAALGIVTTQEAPTTLAVAIPVVSFGLPILDTGLALLRRFLRREPIFRPDRGHIHHRLRDLGHSSRKIALLLYAACAAFALLSLLLVEPSGSGAGVAFMLCGAVVWLTVQRLDIPELLEVRRMVGRGLRQRSVIAHNIRIREATARLRGATSPEGVLRALGYAFEAGEFERVSMWLPARVGAPLRHCRGVDRHGAGYLWCWSLNGAVPDELWEVQIPFRDGAGHSGRADGHLSLWRSSRGDYLLTDIRLIALQLQPAVRGALGRLEREWTDPTPVGEPARGRVAVG